MDKLIALMTIVGLLAQAPVTGKCESNTIIDRIEEDTYAVCEVQYGQMVNVPVTDFSWDVKEGDSFFATSCVGTFTGTFEDIYGTTLYQFKSYDDKDWWCGTSEFFGVTPELNKEYVIIYFDNNTEYDEDNIFLAIYESRV